MTDWDAVIRVSEVALRVPKRELVSDLTFDVAFGATLALVGPSGSGKTTLLECLAGIAVPDAGEIRIGDTVLSQQPAPQRSRVRLTTIGMVFQFGDLLPELSVVGNVALPLQLGGMRRGPAERKAADALASVGLSDFARAMPASLSGGETQRVAIARAIVTDPSVILADEPTGALDERNSLLITELLIERARTVPAALVVATHDPLVYSRMDASLDLRRFAPTESLTAR